MQTSREFVLYNIIICLEVIEHVANVETFMFQMTRLLKPGGMIIISTINKTIKSLFLAKFIAEYVFNLLPKGSHSFNKFLKPSEINRYLLDYSLSINELKGISIDLFNNNWYLSDEIDVNYLAYIKG